MKNLTVYVITNPNGKTQIRTTPMGKWLDTPEAEGFTQVAAELNWKAARAIARQFLGANKKEPS